MLLPQYSQSLSSYLNYLFEETRAYSLLFFDNRGVLCGRLGAYTITSLEELRYKAKYIVSLVKNINNNAPMIFQQETFIILSFFKQQKSVLSHSQFQKLFPPPLKKYVLQEAGHKISDALTQGKENNDEGDTKEKTIE